MGEAPQPSGSRTPAGAISFVAGTGEYEEKTLVLKIENATEYLTTSNRGLYQSGLTFEAGDYTRYDGTQAAATWNWHFQYDRDNGVDWVGGLLHFPCFGTAKASYCASLSSGGNPIASYAMEFKEFSGNCCYGKQKLIKKAELLDKTKETNSLEVTLLVKVFCIQVFKPVLQASFHPPTNVIEMWGQMTSDLVKMLESGDGADVDITVPYEAGGEVDETSYTRKVHKNILMARSSMFSKMFAKGSEMVEAKTGKVVIKDLSPKGLDIFLHYIYTGEVLEDFTQILREILNAADKYDCGKLKNFCGHTLLAGVTTANALKMYKLAKLHSLSFAAKGVMEFIHKNTKVVFTEGVIDKVADAEDE